MQIRSQYYNKKKKYRDRSTDDVDVVLVVFYIRDTKHYRVPQDVFRISETLFRGVAPQDTASLRPESMRFLSYIR